MRIRITHQRITIVLQLILLAEAIFAVLGQRWFPAFLFALGVGTLWEIFEFTMDSLFGMNMQKPMLGDPSGLTDTMWDLIVDAVGALVISILGWRYLRNPGKPSFLERWIDGFIERNPRFFRR